MKQRSIIREASIRGKSLHSGEESVLTLKPAPEDHGIVFKRIDLYGKPEISLKAHSIDKDLVRQTTLTQGHATVSTPEHILSALNGCNIDNCIIELNGKECPILDGSARDYVTLIQKAEPIEQQKERDYFTLETPISVTNGSSSLIALPYDGLKITCTSADDRGIHTQHLSQEINCDTYISEIAPSRTFTIYEDIEPLLKMGKIQGGSLDCAIVIRDNKIISKEPLRFKDEFVRHKILDILGDIALLGKPLKAHIIAVRPGHAINSKLTQKLADQLEKKKRGHKSAAKKINDSKILSPDETHLDITRIMNILPQGYPFLLIDRVIGFSDNEEIRAIKNVTINEPFFQGHFPGNPVMPGVLQLEAMAQAAGLLMLRKVSSEDRLAYFMSCDKVKFRQAVIPGDQMHIHAKITKNKGNRFIGAQVECKVEDRIVSCAELMFTIVEAPSLNA